MENARRHEECVQQGLVGGSCPRMRGTVGRACALLAVESFGRDPDREAFLADECALGSDRRTCASAGFRSFCILKEHLAPPVVLPIRGNFLRFLGRRVRALSLTDAQQRVVPPWGADFAPCYAENGRPI